MVNVRRLLQVLRSLGVSYLTHCVLLSKRQLRVDYCLSDSDPLSTCSTQHRPTIRESRTLRRNRVRRQAVRWF